MKTTPLMLIFKLFLISLLPGCIDREHCGISNRELDSGFVRMYVPPVLNEYYDGELNAGELEKYRYYSFSNQLDSIAINFSYNEWEGRRDSLQGIIKPGLPELLISEEKKILDRDPRAGILQREILAINNKMYACIDYLPHLSAYGKACRIRELFTFSHHNRYTMHVFIFNLNNKAGNEFEPTIDSIIQSLVIR
jgi:hypothetical protein